MRKYQAAIQILTSFGYNIFYFRAEEDSKRKLENFHFQKEGVNLLFCISPPTTTKHVENYVQTNIGGLWWIEKKAEWPGTSPEEQYVVTPPGFQFALYIPDWKRQLENGHKQRHHPPPPTPHRAFYPKDKERRSIITQKNFRQSLFSSQTPQKHSISLKSAVVRSGTQILTLTQMN